MPNSRQGCYACIKYFKSCLNIVAHMPFKVQFKLREQGQTDEKMNAYTRKDKFHLPHYFLSLLIRVFDCCRLKPWFLYDSKDPNGDQYTDEYNDYCDDKYASECRNFQYKKLVITRSGLLNLAHAYKTKREVECPEDYDDCLPSLCKHLHWMVTSGKYVFSTDFLARGYRLDRMSAEKMWRITCIPEMTEFADIAQAVFTGNPDILDVEEADNIWQSQPVSDAHRFPHTIDISASKNQYPIPRQAPQDLPIHVPNNVSTPLSRNESAQQPFRSVPARLALFKERLDDLQDSRHSRARSPSQAKSDMNSEEEGSDF